jgi:hypothetical protein
MRASLAKQGEHQEYLDVISLPRQSLQNKQFFTTDSMRTRLPLATRDNLVNIDILTDNGRIFAPELKGHLFEHLTCLLYDFLPNKMWSW